VQWLILESSIVLKTLVIPYVLRLPAGWLPGWLGFDYTYQTKPQPGKEVD